MFYMSFQEVPPTSDENVTVTETTFNNVPVRVYIPHRKSQALRRGVFYIHGGGWCLGSAGMWPLLQILAYHEAFISIRIFTMTYLVNIIMDNGTLQLSEIYFSGTMLV